MTNRGFFFDGLKSQPTEETMNECFVYFDKDRDGQLSVDEFGELCRSLFRDSAGNPYVLEAMKLAQMFYIFDKNGDGFIDKTEFHFCWNKWIKLITFPTAGVIVVDVQNDFISGSLAVSQCSAGHNGEEVVPVINRLLTDLKFSAVVYSMDWHPVDHLSFLDNVSMYPMHSSSKVTAESAKLYDTVVFDGEPLREQVLWPTHCVQNSWGAELHKQLKVMDGAVWVKKGGDALIDSYSAFRDNAARHATGLGDQLRARRITDLFVCGIATDICVAATAMHSLDEGFRTILIEDACRGVDSGDIETFKRNFLARNGIIVNSDQVAGLVAGVDRRPELGFYLAMKLNEFKAI